MINKKNITKPKKETKQRGSLKAKSVESNTAKSNKNKLLVKLKLLVTIVDRKKAEYYTDLIQSFSVNMQMVVLAEGTANANVLELLGFSNNEKAVIFSVIQDVKIPEAMNTLEEKFETIKDGKGVACTIPLTSVIGRLIYGFLSNNRQTVKESKK